MDNVNPIEINNNFRIIDNELEASVQIINRSSHRLYVFNGLWKLDSSNQFVEETLPVYSSIENDSQLNFVIGFPPLPSSKAVFFRIIPHVTLLEPNKSLKLDFTIPLPVNEYNPYFPETSKSTVEEVGIESIQTYVHYVEDIVGMEVQPSLVVAGCFEILTPEVWDMKKTASSNKLPISIRLLKRLDEFERYSLITKKEADSLKQGQINN